MEDQGGGGSIRIDKLTDSNFYVWKQKIQLLLALRDVDQYIVEGRVPSEERAEERKKWIRGDSKAKALIGLSLSDEHLEHVRDVDTAHEMWEAIVNVFERHTLLNKLAARREFYTVKMLSGEKVLAYINRVKQLAAILKSMSVNIDDKEMAMAVLNGLPARFEALIVALDALGNEEKIFSLDFVKSRLLQEEQRANMKSSSSQTSALVNRAPNNRDINDYKCTNCGHTGHTATRCWGKDLNGRRPAPPSGYKPRMSQRKQSAFVTQKPDPDMVVNSVDFTCLMSKASHTNDLEMLPSWLVDSACTAHITYDRSLFATYEPLESASVQMGTKASAKVAGRGDVHLKLNVNGRIEPCKLTDVLHVPDFAFSLLSVSRMTELGLKVGFENGKCMIRRGSTVVATATLVGELYVLDIVSDIGSAHAATLQTWHERFAHVHSQGIASMIRDNVVSGVKLLGNEANKINNTDNDCISEKCSACVYGKATRSVIPKERSSRRAYFCLDLVHSDVCGPLEVQSIGGAKYFITFIDDHSNWSVVYPMHHKSEAFERYKMFAQLAQTHTGRKIKVLRTDRGGEYLSTEFKSFLIANGTQHQMTTAYTPEQNGVAERLNRTLVNLVRSMLAHKKVTKGFWAEALANAVYVRNRVTSRAIPPKMTPYHLWMKSVPNVGHLRVFGSKCWYTLPKHNIQKLDARAKEAMFLGYAENTKAYKLWDGDLHKVIVSRDVTFDESTGGKSGEPMDTNEEATTDDDTINLNIDEEVAENDAVASEASSPDEQQDSDESSNSSPTAGEDETTETVEQHVVEEETIDPPTNLRRSTRIRKTPGAWWAAALVTAGLLSHAHVITEIPNSYKQAMDSPKARFWQKGIDKELASQHKNKTWTLVPRSQASNVLTSRWVFGVKQLPDESGKLVETAKGRLVARGFQQVEGIDYTETFAPVIKFTTIRLLLALVAHFDLELHQMDVVTAFLNGDLHEEIYMEQPEGCIDKVKPDSVCKLLKAIYGLKQAHRQWHSKIDEFLITELGFNTTRSDPCLYIRRQGNVIMIIALYVDDLLLAGSDLEAILWMKNELNKRFDMKDLGEAKTCIGLEIDRIRSKHVLTVTQSKYAQAVLKRFKMSACNPCVTPMEQSRHVTMQVAETGTDDNPCFEPYRQAIGCLMFLMVGTRPDIAFAIGKLSQHCADPHESHWSGVKRVLRYLRGSQHLGIVFGKDDLGTELHGYSDADWGGCLESRKSTSGYVFKLCDGPISWASRKQTVVAKSTCEAEYIALSEACKEAAWLRRFHADVLGANSDPTIRVGCDNAGTIAFAQNESTNRRNKHIDITYHFVRDAVQRKLVTLYHCPTTEMPADMLTKPLGRVLFEKFVGMVGLSECKAAQSM